MSDDTIDRTTGASDGTPERQSTTPSSPEQGSAAFERPVRQIDAIIENLSSYATPVLREIAARAAELAARAGQAAGPIAYKAAGKTEEVGGRVATKGREIATDLRRDIPGGPTATDSEAEVPTDEPPRNPVGTI